MAKDTNTHTYECKQMHPHKQLNSWPNCWCALITHTPHVPSSSLVCHNCQLATSICARSRFKYAFALSTQLVSFLISVVNKYTTQFGAEALKYHAAFHLPCFLASLLPAERIFSIIYQVSFHKMSRTAKMFPVGSL